MKSPWSILLPILVCAALVFLGVRYLIMKKDYIPPQVTAEAPPTPGIAAQDTATELPLIEAEKIDLQQEDGYFRIDWKILSKIDFEERYNEDVADYIFYPLFHPSIKRLEGEQVIIKGYVIPIEETGQEDLLILSAFPFTECFFCGNAGPESVMDIQLKKPVGKRIKKDKEMEFRGKLHLNETDLYYMNYMLLEAEPVE
ncbi:MAG: hypothetical protein KDC34_10520 [Saprospiraceae bacterium]|nr:hypothetical protein [Saprospiraceae bacterium]